MADQSEADLTVRTLIERHRTLMSSDDPMERFKTLWIAATLDHYLLNCTDKEIAKLMIFVQEKLVVFEPEMAILYHARWRLMRLASNRVLQDY
jgi:hypothetical protein